MASFHSKNQEKKEIDAMAVIELIWVIDCRIYTILAVALYVNILSCNMWWLIGWLMACIIVNSSYSGPLNG